ncbi:unnamed protein product [Blumeria hordei]|uniref:DUF2470 domain-containing protein n=1 Tax=Blumeria hordei TaxID=2867405 RepID=A0A383UW90_BLUHO|nr:unnamed protein product [Blumeria hordei]
MSDLEIEATKARIIKHMNADHADSLSLFLQFYSHLSPQAATGAKIIDISLNELKLQTSDQQIEMITIEPPMNTWTEVRTRMVEMDTLAREALDVSNIYITNYLPPKKLIHKTVFGTCLFTFVNFALAWRKSIIVSGTYYYDKILIWFPGGPEMFLKVANMITLPVIAIHLAEAYYLDRSRLRRHGIHRGTKVWYLWILSCFVEGIGCFQRFDAEVRRKKDLAAKAKH